MNRPLRRTPRLLRGQPLLLAGALGLLLLARGPAQEPTAPAAGDPAVAEQATALFNAKIAPLLQAHCLECHAGAKAKGELDLTTREGLLRGGETGPAIVSGDADASLLVKLMAHEEIPHMPHKADKLPRESIDAIAAWIDDGAPYAQPLTWNDDGGASVPIEQPAGEWAGDPAAALFIEHVRPVFENQCLECHGGAAKRSGLDLSSRKGLLRGGDHAAAVVPGDSAQSMLYMKISHQDQPGMPYQRQKLPDEVIARIAEWIDAGAPYDQPLDAHGDDGAKDPAERVEVDHWAYKVPARPAIPDVKNSGWVRNPIDAFIAATHEAKGLTPLPPADKRVLLRRAYLDLIGMPPTPEQTRSFLVDASENAYEKVVDELLASPHYGERWGRHWMDVWRYSDAYSNDYNSQKHIWRWRDWIIESLNEDKGYDQMLREMLAGDEVAPDDPQTVRATGFLGRNYNKNNRNIWLEDTVDHTAMAFMAMTMKCARCHDHKYDPIAQEEYYQFRAFFEPLNVRIDRVPGQVDRNADGVPRVFDADASKETYLFVRGNEQHPDEENPIAPAVPAVLRGEIAIEPVGLPFEASYPDHRPFVLEGLIDEAGEKIKAAKTGLDESTSTLAASERRVAELPAWGGRQTWTTPTAPIQLPDAETLQTMSVLELREFLDPLRAVAPAAQQELQVVEAYVALEQAHGAVALAEREWIAARSHLPALKARIAADNAKLCDPPLPNVDTLVREARKAERLARLSKADADLLRARQRLAPVLAEQLGKVDQPLEKLTLEEEVAANIADKAAIARGQVQAALDEIAGAYLFGNHTPIGETYPKTSTGRRRALAEWLTSEQNPLTARVAANHIWLRHFGAALVGTVYDFGVRAKPPTHPELLDWLAIEMIENGWSMKKIHRLIVTSNTYRMQSTALAPEHANAAIDPDNRYLWGMNTRRMQAEAVRDSVLQVAGRLDAKIGGPPIKPYPEGGKKSWRRSVYFQHTPDVQAEFLSVFDGANPIECYRRTESVVPQQALAMLNSDLALSEARELARRLSEELGELAGADAFAAAAFERVLGRPPTAEERIKCEQFLSDQAKLLEQPEKLTALGPKTPPEGAAEGPEPIDPQLRARGGLIHVLFNHNEFVTIQ